MEEGRGAGDICQIREYGIVNINRQEVYEVYR